MRKLDLARDAHTEVVVELTGVRGYVQSVSPTGSHVCVWDGKGVIEVPLGRIADVRPPTEYDGERVPAPARKRIERPIAEQTALDFSNEQMRLRF